MRSTIVLILGLIAVVLAGCFVPGCGPIATTASTQPTSAPSLVLIATDATTALDDAVNWIHLLITDGVITDAEYTGYIRPAIVQAQGYIATMDAAAANNDSLSFQTAENLLDNVMSTIHAYSGRAPSPTTKKAKAG